MKIKILYAPYNIASMPAITLDALENIEGVETRGISIVNHPALSFGKNSDKTWKIFNVYESLINPIILIKNLLITEYFLCKRIFWADFIIWQWDTRIYLPHFWVLKLVAKPMLIEWVGSDIRIPEVVINNNPYYANELKSGSYTYTMESKSRSNWIQKKFKFLNAIPYLCPEMTLFLNKNLFPYYLPTFQRIEIKKYKPIYPDRNNLNVSIVHTPSAKGAKGTKYVQQIVDRLKQKFDFDYTEIHNKTHAESLQAISTADLFLDQFIGGSYGMATCEALAMGKPVFCYLMDSFVELLPSDTPIINTNPDTLESNLIRFLTDPDLRHRTGILSRNFAEKYHDSDKLAVELYDYIKGSIKRRKNLSS